MPDILDATLGKNANQNNQDQALRQFTFKAPMGPLGNMRINTMVNRNQGYQNVDGPPKEEVAKKGQNIGRKRSSKIDLD
jgi:hypothetical protein